MCLLMYLEMANATKVHCLLDGKKNYLEFWFSSYFSNMYEENVDIPNGRTFSIRLWLSYTTLPARYLAKLLTLV